MRGLFLKPIVMIHIICLTKEDIETTPNGLHYNITTKSGLIVNFTPEAVDEFIADIKAIREAQEEKNVSIN